MATRWLDEDEQRTWRAFIEASGLLMDQLDRELQRDAGMPHAYYEILVRLSEQPDRSLRMSELAERSQSSRSRVSHAVARLEEAGWVRRESVPDDRRAALAVLTDEGFAALAAAAPGHVEGVRRHLLDRLTPAQVVALRRISEAVRDPLIRRSGSMNVHSDRVAAFHKLHASGCFVMPNPWDVGTARVLAGLGFPALATTSAGFAWSLGRTDDGVTLDEALEHLRAVVDAVDLPVNADFQGGFAVDPEQVHANVTRAAATGVAGLSIEDSTGDESHPLHDFDLAVDRIRAARQAIDDSGTGVVLTGRSEGFVVGVPDLDETTRRLRAYAEAGADCLYAPRISTVEQVRAVIEAVAPKPVNLLMNAPFITVAEAAALGVRRISVGGTFARTAWAGFLEAARELADAGTVSRFEGLPDVEALMQNR